MANAFNRRSKEETMILLEKLRKNLTSAEDIMKNKVKSEDVVMFIGNTKAGKSTLINDLIGNQLVACKDPESQGRFKPLHVYKACDAEGPEIGCNATAKTTEPHRWIASEECGSFVLYDCPGLCDNRGPVQAITNAYYIHHIFQKVTSVKIALVVDINDIVHDKINSFLSLLTSVENIFRDIFEQCFSSFVIIFTKVPPTIEDEPTDVDYLRDMLKLKCLLSESLNISKYSRNLVKYFIDHSESIGIFKKATEGAISSDITINVVQALRDTSQIPGSLLKQFSFPSIDSDSKVFLYEIKNDLASKETFDETVKFIQNVFDRIATNFDEQSQKKSLTTEQVIESKEKISSVRDKIRSANAADDIFAKLKALKNVHPAIKSKINDSDVVNTIKLLEFIDGLLNMAEIEVCNLTLKSIMERVCFRMDNIIVKMQYNLHDIKIEQYEQLMKTMQEEYKNSIEEILIRTVEVAEQNAEVSRSLGFFSKMGHYMDCAIKSVFGVDTDMPCESTLAEIIKYMRDRAEGVLRQFNIQIPLSSLMHQSASMISY